MQALLDRLEQVTVGEPVTFRNLTMLPLLNRPAVAQPEGAPHQREGVDGPEGCAYRTLEEALAAGEVEVGEHRRGRISRLRLVNRGDQPVLLLDGELLVGARQNRVVNLSLLAPARATQVIPVSCVEQGRWSAPAPVFVSPSSFFTAGRAAQMEQVTAAHCAGGMAAADQEAVWRSVRQRARLLAVSSPTNALEALFQCNASLLEEYVFALSPSDGQAGALFVLDGVVVGMDLLDSSGTYRKLSPRLVRGYALDALVRLGSEALIPQEVGPETGYAFLTALRAAAGLDGPAVGMGEHLRLAGAGVGGARLTGTVLTCAGKVIHLAAFQRRSGTRPEPRPEEAPSHTPRFLRSRGSGLRRLRLMGLC